MYASGMVLAGTSPVASTSTQPEATSKSADNAERVLSSGSNSRGCLPDQTSSPRRTPTAMVMWTTATQHRSDAAIKPIDSALIPQT